MELEQVPFDLHHLVHSAVRLLNTRVGDKSVELVSDVGSDVPQRVVADPHRLRQVLTNLIGNAIKFTHEGEVVVSVRRVSENGRARWWLDVLSRGGRVLTRAGANPSRHIRMRPDRFGRELSFRAGEPGRLYAAQPAAGPRRLCVHRDHAHLHRP
jgi:signal transduction histidine kinase